MSAPLTVLGYGQMNRQQKEMFQIDGNGCAGHLGEGGDSQSQY